MPDAVLQYTEVRLRAHSGTRLRGYAATRLRGYAATPRGYAATVDNDGHINQQPNRGHVDSRVTDAPTSNIVIV